jgi:hypothetical protein
MIFYLKGLDLLFQGYFDGNIGNSPRTREEEDGPETTLVIPVHLKGTMMRSKGMIFLTACALFIVSQKSNAEVAAGIIIGEPTGVSVRIDHFPVLGFAWSLHNNWMYVHGDYIFIDEVLSDPLRWYLGGGLFLGINDESVGFGVRVPVGLQIRFHRNFEVFGELAPGLALIEETGLYLGGGIGIRYVF